MSLSAFEKRVKRHVTAPPRDFYAATAPGLESLCLRELRTILPGRPMRRLGAGIEFNARLHEAYLANLWLRTANRVLMRIDTFKATRWDTFEKKAGALAWELFLPGECPLQFRVTARQSRLYHSDAIAARLANSISKRLAECAPQHSTSATAQTVFARLLADRLTLSLDSSGEHLHRRGVKVNVAAAPLRETIAAAALMLAEYAPPEPLLDPMCGSGTFSIEAAMLSCRVPPGWFRDFAFTQWPAFGVNYKRWQYLKDQSGKNMLSPDRPVVFASDRDERACGILRKNIASYGMSPAVGIEKKDFFDLVPAGYAHRPGLVVLNPPYGRRIGSAADSDRLFRQIVLKLKKDFRGWKTALIVPRRYLLESIPFAFRPHKVAAGGLNLYITVATVE